MQYYVEIHDARMDSWPPWQDVVRLEASRAYGVAVTVDENAFALGGIQDTKHNGMVERMMVEQTHETESHHPHTFSVIVLFWVHVLQT